MRGLSGKFLHCLKWHVMPALADILKTLIVTWDQGSVAFVRLMCNDVPEVVHT
jgi:hypothetical protein